MKQADVIIVGSGVASLQLAAHLRKTTNVIIITKSSMDNSNSSLAQGGIAAAIGKEDHPHFHYLDTLEAGRYFNDSAAVMQLTEEAPEIIEELLGLNCPFDLDHHGTLLLAQEGSHSHHRVVHGGGDQTGRRIVECLKSELTPNIQVYEHELVYELLINDSGGCYGVKSKGRAGTNHIFTAPYVVLSTGGCGQLYSLTSNAASATGDGMALAYQAGAELADMEFIQFHPTLLYCEGETKGLVSEAVRGEGAKLLNDDEDWIMEGVHPLRDLAPRHVVSQTIFQHLHRGHNVFLDITPIKNFGERFPTISSLCKEHGIDLQEGKIPVVPGCHFSMGGVQTNNVGLTNIQGLYALGEVACTGVHGANRLASNSLLEGLVFGKRLAQHINHLNSHDLNVRPRPLIKSSPPITPLPLQEEIQATMMERVGIVRDETSLHQQKEWIESFNLKEWSRCNFDMLTTEQVTIVLMLQTAWLLTVSAIERTESRGGHFRRDFPYESASWQDKQIILKDENYESLKA